MDGETRNMPDTLLPPGVIAADTITKPGPEARGRVMISGSHGGAYPAYLAVKAGLRAVILNDAGVGKDSAGIGCLDYCGQRSMAAATVAHDSCRIGDAADMLARGRISHANAIARACGVEAGQSCFEAAERLRAAPLPHVLPLGKGEKQESRRVLKGVGLRIVLIDSAALIEPDDAGQIVITGSHGGLVGGNPAMALRVDAYAAFFNDAGFGADDWGISRLPALDERGIVAATVATASARIGEAESTWRDGVLSAVNRTAQRVGLAVGQSCVDAVTLLSG
jgi:hypothetical protein